MAKKDDNTDLDRLLQQEAVDPLRLEQFLDSWNELTDRDTAERSLMLSGGMDRDITAALQSLEQAGSSLTDSAALRVKLSAFPHPTMLTRDDGIVLSINDAAFERLSIEPGQSIDKLPLSATTGRDLSEEVRHALRERRNRNGLTFIPAIDDAQDRNLMLTILTHDAPGPQSRTAVVIAVDPVWSQDFKTLFIEAYGLTDAEAEVLVSFLNGQSLEQIAEARGRSLLTIRTQLQSVLAKSGARSQAEVMRLAAAIGQFGRDVADVSDLVSHPHRRRFEIPAADGRKIEFYLSGDMTGAPILFVPDITTITFPATVEAALTEAGLCVASVLRPGCGMTDPFPDGDVGAGIANDLATVARQLGWQRPALLFHSSSCHFSTRLARELAELISCVLLCSVPAPPPYLRETPESAPWLVSMARARSASPVLFRLIVTAGIMGWRALGTQRFATIQLRSNSRDVEELRNRESLREMDRAMRSYFSQSTAEICADARRIFSDWSRDWGSLPVRISVLQGTEDRTAAIEAVRDFVDQHDGEIDLNVIEGAGFLLPATHTDAFTDWLVKENCRRLE